MHSGREKVAEMLIKNGANASLTDKLARTALHSTVSKPHGNLKIYWHLAEFGLKLIIIFQVVKRLWNC